MHTHAVVIITDPNMSRGIHQTKDSDGTVLQERLVVEGLARVMLAGFVKSCSMAEEWSETIENAIEDPYNPIVDGAILHVCMN